jgi:hypothetical protein
MLIDLFAYFVGFAMVDLHPARRDMPFRRLITFPKRASLQLGIDPAFGEVARFLALLGKDAMDASSLLVVREASRRVDKRRIAQGKETAVWNIVVPGRR